jgi:mannose/fructose/N-acetylgalactosamine-specific phosphotransferase system component IIC
LYRVAQAVGGPTTGVTVRLVRSHAAVCVIVGLVRGHAAACVLVGPAVRLAYRVADGWPGQPVRSESETHVQLNR